MRSLVVKTSVIGAVFFALIAAIVFFMVAPQFFAGALLFLQRSAMFFMIAAVAGLAWLVFELKWNEESWLGVGALGVTLLTCLSLIFVQGTIGGYYAAQQVSSSAPVEEKVTEGEWDQRGPLIAAQRQAEASATGDAQARLMSGATRYIPERKEFSSLTERPTFWGQYRSVVTQETRLAGLNKAHTCMFSPESNMVHTNHFVNSLRKGIKKQGGHFMSFYDEDDVYGYCNDKDEPVVVAPLWRMKGIFRKTYVADGVAVFNGATNTLVVHDSGEGIPGATYPQRVAAQQLKATQSSGSFWDWVFNRAGYVGADPESVNIIMGKDGKPFYVSQLVHARQSSDSANAAVTGLMRVSASSPKAGSLNTPFVELFGGDNASQPWRPDSAIADRIRADYSNIPNWQEFDVHEIVPVDSSRFVATVGTPQNVRYRIVGMGDLSTLPGQPEGVSTCLYEGDSTEPVQCGTEALKGSNGVGVKMGERGDADSSEGGSSASPGDVSSMSDAELIEFARRALDELESRSGN